MLREEYPRPQFEREDWMNLNGPWNYAFDFSLSGEEHGWSSDTSAMTGTINVPFCPESSLSGVGYTDFIPAIWYSRSFSVPDAWKGKRVFLNFGAVDYETKAFINGKEAGTHTGGGASFGFDITGLLKDGTNTVVVYAKDETRGGFQPRGKQSERLGSYGCMYTRTTGIWQTVWLEAAGEAYIESVKTETDIDNGFAIFTPVFRHTEKGQRFEIEISKEGKTVFSGQYEPSGAPVAVKMDDPVLWRPENPFLYDVAFSLLDAGGARREFGKSYFGFRKIHIKGNKFYLNNKEIFLRFVLDQGFYPDGIWTAPSDEALKNDIELSLAAGFNGARLHQKVFEERYLYHADRLGYLVWGEYYDWGINYDSYHSFYDHIAEWSDIIQRDRNHPSIIAWTPFNETVGGARANRKLHDRHVSDIVRLTKKLDLSRPVNDTSGYVHVMTDIYTVHDYQQDRDKFAAFYADIKEGESYEHMPADVHVQGYKGQPFVIDEYGGTWWEQDPEGGQNWGYG
ncbi:MAG: hypothetical protein ILO36_06625, partial [Abditibacteriota bacterium]|nr:hypothetical protein [Abditibacteriota bacterium]